MTMDELGNQSMISAISTRFDDTRRVSPAREGLDHLIWELNRSSQPIRVRVTGAVGFLYGRKSTAHFALGETVLVEMG